MVYGKVEICGVNTAKLPVLSGEETNSLLKKYRDGDLSARDELISGNLRLVLSVIQRFSNRGEAVDDLFQVGCVGLIKAIDNFDITLGLRPPMPYLWLSARYEDTFATTAQSAFHAQCATRHTKHCR